MTDWHGLLDGMTAIVRNTFGEPVPVQYVRGEDDSTHEVTGVFDYEAELAEAGGRLPARTRTPVLDVRPKDLGFEPLPEDAVTIDGQGTFRVVDTGMSSSGMTRLYLRKTA